MLHSEFMNILEKVLSNTPTNFEPSRGQQDLITFLTDLLEMINLFLELFPVVITVPFAKQGDCRDTISR